MLLNNKTVCNVFEYYRRAPLSPSFHQSTGCLKRLLASKSTVQIVSLLLTTESQQELIKLEKRQLYKQNIKYYLRGISS